MHWELLNHSSRKSNKGREGQRGEGMRRERVGERAIHDFHYCLFFVWMTCL